ncbi:PHD finger protein 20-like protein 1 [Cimex lectularius]|uniref:Uncharacterized protein n=1 Tax=Cimex lectularius TaxID=79782 RepID=A0A8I6RFI1_CIMLE|nr:PHD finger protein 20-like protein 1 [Cimex lectularius]
MDSEVPDQYVCYICRYPAKVRASKKYSYAIHYLTQGKLPSFSFRTKNERDIKQRESVLKKCYEISQRLHEIKNVDQSLRVKINIAEQPDHPKHYLWAKSWSEKNFNGVEKPGRGSLSDNQTEEKSPDHENKLGNRVPVPPEAQIDTAECRLRLLEHVDDYLQSMDDRLTSLQTQIAALESQDIDLSSNISSDKLTKQTIQMLLRDLKSVQKLAAIS